MKRPCSLPVIPASRPDPILRILHSPCNLGGGCRAPSCNAGGIMSVACLDSSASPVTEIESVAEATADATEIVETTVAVRIEVDYPAAMAPPLQSVHDFSCPICLELLLRPVALSCGHRFCRGCWLRVLQSQEVRATAYFTKCVACPFRCEVRPVVPEVDQVLASELESLFGDQYTGRTCAYALPDEEHAATEVNAWEAAGCLTIAVGGGVHFSPTISWQDLDLDSSTATTASSATTARNWWARKRQRTVVTLLAAVGALLVCTFSGLMILMIVDNVGSRTFHERSVARARVQTLVAVTAGLSVLQGLLLAIRIHTPDQVSPHFGRHFV